MNSMHLIACELPVCAFDSISFLCAWELTHEMTQSAFRYVFVATSEIEKQTDGTTATHR